MPELIDAKNTAAVRNRACNELKTRIINKIITGIYDFTKASEFFITHDYLDITISWGDAS